MILLNNDVLPLPGWLAALERYAEEHPRAGIVGALLLWPDRSVQHAGVVVGSDGFLRHLYAGLPGDHPAPRRSRRLQAVTGAVMLVRRSVWDELGGLDEEFRNSFEDIDLCLRAGQLGYEVHFCGEAVLMHLESATRGWMPHGDLENSRRLTARWGQLRPDDLDHYAADGLVSARHLATGVEVRVDPLLGQPAVPDLSEIDGLLTRRSQEVHDLRREVLRLRARAGEPWQGVLADPPAPRSATVIIAVAHQTDLIATLDALEQQSASLDDFDVVVVDFEHKLSPAAREALTRQRRLRVRGLAVEGGRAAAWNRGIREATGELVILLADDFVPTREFVAHHLRVHHEDPAPELVGIGPALFPESIRRDPFARWIEDSRNLWGVSFTHPNEELMDGWFYCGNTSAKRSFLTEAGGSTSAFPTTRAMTRSSGCGFGPGACAPPTSPAPWRSTTIP